MQHLLDVVALVTEGLGEVAELVDRFDQRRVVFAQEPFDVRKRLVERAQGVVEVARAIGEDLRHRGHMAGELHNLFVALRERVDQHLQILDRAEDVVARITKASSHLRQFPQRVVERVAVAVEGVCGLVDRRPSGP